MKAFKDFDIFIHTAETGSLSAAAKIMGLTPAATSAALKRLEQELATQLIIRSTRSLRLTPQGETFLDYARDALATINQGRETLQQQSNEIKGTIQLSMPSDLGRNILLPWLDEFQQLHPRINMRLQTSDRITDVYRQSVDITLRYGVPKDGHFIALPIFKDNYRVLCASPEYIKSYPLLDTPADLDHHNCLRFFVADYIYDKWTFTQSSKMREPKTLTVKVSGNRVSDDGEIVRRWALSGQGIAYKSHLDIIGDLKNHRLIRLCPSWQGENTPLNMICADRAQLSPAVTALRNFLSQRCETLSELSSLL